ncbi:calcium/proton exchanger [Tanacetum coccineum]
MSYVQFRDVIRKLVHGPVASLYYCKVGTPLRIGIKPIQNDSDVDQFVNFAYKNKWQVNLYVEHSGYDVLDIRDQGETIADDGNESSDAYCSSDEEDLRYIDFHSELDDNVVINTISTNDPFFNKLCGDNPEFINLVDEPVNENVETVEEDTENIDPVFNVKEGISYVTHNPNQDWKKMEPILRMRDVESGRCAGANSLKKRKKKELGKDKSLKVNKVSTRSKSKSGEGTSKSLKTHVKAITSGEGTSKSPKTPVKAVNSGEACFESPKWTKSKVKIDRKKLVCGFRLYASWMSTEHSFQIKSLKPEHNSSRNYNLGSLVTYKWIAHHYAKKLIADPFIPYLQMKNEIRKKFLINDILDSNPGSTCRLDDEETESGNYYFRRFYVCFKGVKDGWLAGCRKVIGLDGCFLKHTCRGELLVAMGRDANNQMYPIAWAVVKVENNDNWCWFISLIQEDLQLETGEGLTIIFDSHKGLLEGVNELLPNAKHRKCIRHLFANYKKKFSGVQLQCLFWNAASTTVEQLYYSKMEELKIISTEAYQYLCDRNPNSWCRAFFRQESKCLNFENGICESFNRAILVQRTKPIITMLEDIRLYVMQRLVTTNQVVKKPPVPKPKINRPSVLKPHELETIGGGGGGEVSARGRGRGSRGGRGGFGGRGEGTATIGDTGRSQRGRERGQRGRGGGQMQRDGEQMTEDEIRKNLEHEYMKEMLVQRENDTATMSGLVLAAHTTYQAQQDEFDQEALRCTMEEEARNLTTVDANVQTQESVAANINDRGEIWFRLGDFEAEIPSEEPIAAVTPSADKGKQLAEPNEQPELQLRRSKRKAPTSSEEALAEQRIIFHKNRGRSERIFNQTMKKYGFRKDGEGSTLEKAFSLI